MGTTTPKKPVRATITVEEAAKILGISRTNAYRAARKRQLPMIRIGHRILILREPFERMLKGLPRHTEGKE